MYLVKLPTNKVIFSEDAKRGEIIATVPNNIQEVDARMLVLAARQFYFDEDYGIEINDTDYDALVNKYQLNTQLVMAMFPEFEDGDVSPDFLDSIAYPLDGKWDSEDIFGELEAILDSETVPQIALPKLDGSSLIAWYKNGKLAQIFSASKFQTEKFKSFFPKEVSKEITAIRGEAIIPKEVWDTVEVGRHFGLSRAKANGLVNSKYLQKDIDELLMVAYTRVYKDSLFESIEDYRELYESIPDTESGFKLPLFSINDILPEVEGTLGIIDFEHNTITLDQGTFLIDGIVTTYIATGTNWVDGIKIKYSDYRITKTTGISYEYSDKDKYIPTYQLEASDIDGTEIDSASTGSVKKMFDLQAGIGATVKVVKVKLTNPQIVEVEGSSEDYALPFDCECGTPVTEESVIGSDLYCINPYCDLKLKTRLGILENWVGYTASYAVDNNEYFAVFGELLNISKWNWNNKLAFEYNTNEEFNQKSLEFHNWLIGLDIASESFDLEQAIETLLEYFSFSSTAREILGIMFYATVQVYQGFFNGSYVTPVIEPVEEEEFEESEEDEEMSEEDFDDEFETDESEE